VGSSGDSRGNPLSSTLPFVFMAMSPEGTLDPAFFPDPAAPAETPHAPTKLKEQVAAFERGLIVAAMDAAKAIKAKPRGCSTWGARPYRTTCASTGCLRLRRPTPQTPKPAKRRGRADLPSLTPAGRSPSPCNKICVQRSAIAALGTAICAGPQQDQCAGARDQWPGAGQLNTA